MWLGVALKNPSMRGEVIGERCVFSSQGDDQQRRYLAAGSPVSAAWIKICEDHPDFAVTLTARIRSRLAENQNKLRKISHDEQPECAVPDHVSGHGGMGPKRAPGPVFLDPLTGLHLHDTLSLRTLVLARSGVRVYGLADAATPGVVFTGEHYFTDDGPARIALMRPPKR